MFDWQQGDSKPNKDFKKTRTNDDVDSVFTEFIGDDNEIRVSGNFVSFSLKWMDNSIAFSLWSFSLFA